MGKNQKINTIEKAIQYAHDQPTQVHIMMDDFDVIDFLKSIKRFTFFEDYENGDDIIKKFDNSGVGKDVVVTFIEKNIVFIVLKFGLEDDSGLGVIFSKNREGLFQWFRSPSAPPNAAPIVLKWLLKAETSKK